jgi:hypothetical protein
MVLGAAMVVRRRILSEGDAEPQCYSGLCGCDFFSSMQRPLPKGVTHMAIYTKTDGVIDWRCCVTDDPEKDVEVRGTHVGLVFNPQVYGHVADLLAATSERAEELADSQSA